LVVASVGFEKGDAWGFARPPFDLDQFQPLKLV
jgi:hypothetical protein